MPPRTAEPTGVERRTADRDAIDALQRAFSTLSRQDVSFDRCDVRVMTADRAVASCRGVLNYVPKIGDGSAQQRRLSWSFDFLRAADRWMISRVTAR